MDQRIGPISDGLKDRIGIVQVKHINKDVMQWIARGLLVEAKYDYCCQSTMIYMYHPDFRVANRSESAPHYMLHLEAVIGNYKEYSVREL